MTRPAGGNDNEAVNIPRGLVVFDLDGTLLRGPTVCEILAAPLGKSAEMAAFEALREQAKIAEARVEMARWYSAMPREQLVESLRSADWAPGAKEGVALLRDGGFELAIASVTWDFAVAWFARELGVKHYLGTGLGPDGAIQHRWGEHKASWLLELGHTLGIPKDRIAAVGDSAGDTEMLSAASLRFFVGANPPSGLSCVHLPAADIREIAGSIIENWPATR